MPDPEPTDIGVDEEPEIVVDVEAEPEPETVGQLPPGDPELRERAIGLILDARKKRDKELAANASALKISLKDLSRDAKDDERKYIENLGESLVNNRIPLTKGVSGIPDKIGVTLSDARAKERCGHCKPPIGSHTYSRRIRVPARRSGGWKFRRRPQQAPSSTSKTGGRSAGMDQTARARV